MMNMMNPDPSLTYTVEVYKTDKRTKLGEKLVHKYDGPNVHDLKSFVRNAVNAYPGYRVVVHKTFVTRTNAMTGEEFQERYDRPYYCSPSSETYWSS